MKLNPESVEDIAATVHTAWMAAKKGQGFTRREAEWGEDLMVPYDRLSGRAKDLGRATVRAVLDALPDAGYELVRR